MRRINLFIENIRVALRSIRINLLRSILTALIIAVGLTALVGILTAIDSIKGSITEEFSSMGANTFSIKSRGMNVTVNGKRYRTKNYSYISYYQAKKFKERFDFPGTVSISVVTTGIGTLKYESEKTNPNVRIIGIDDTYLSTSGYKVKQGRGFSSDDMDAVKNVAILASGTAKKLFKNNESPVGKMINVGAGKYRVIGVLEDKGGSFGGGGNRICFIPYTSARSYFSRPNMNFTIQVKAENPQMIDATMGASEALFRTIRGLVPIDESDFNLEKSDNLANILLNSIKNITLVATIIGFITLFGAAVGLMNIMLVSVTERTREIGLRKAVGATSKVIKQQFLVEAIVISEIGGILGIILGILIGNVVSSLIGSSFIIPWTWIIVGVILCIIVGIVSGFYPANKAANLDPIDSLRYE